MSVPKKTAHPKRKRGRPRIVVPEDDLLEWIAEGKTLREFCRLPGTPNYATIYRRAQEDEDFAQRLARAREIGFQVIAEEVVDIADNAANDWMERHDKDGGCIGWQLNGDHVQRSKLRVETRLKLLACWDPKRYGNKVAVDQNSKVEHSGKVETVGPPVPPTEDLVTGISKLHEMAQELFGDG